MDNFDFIKDSHPEFYERIRQVESEIFRNYKTAGHRTRLLLESAMAMLTDRYDLEDEIRFFSGKTYRDELKLYDYCKCFTAKSFCDRVRSRKPELRKGLKNIQLPTVEVYMQPRTKPEAIVFANLQRKDETGIKFLRTYGNECSHDDPSRRRYLVCYENTLTQMKLFHELMQTYFRTDELKEEFNENLIPIGKYTILSNKIPRDAARTGCEMEYVAYDQEDLRNPYAILRKYTVNPDCYVWQNRCIETFSAADGPANGIPDGMAVMNIVSKGTDQYNPSYIISYNFSREPQNLTTELLQKISLEERVEICQKIACFMHNLHNSKTPIYHRMLTDDCIRISDFTDGERGWVPSIINFEFAKIYRAENENRNTVIGPRQDASDHMEPETVKYQAPEFCDKDSEALDWSKVDIYSMGILFIDILCSQISFEKQDINSVNGLDHKVVKLIEEMISENPDTRPEVNQIIARLESINNDFKQIPGNGSLITKLFKKLFR